jgi:hypothetical protein
MARKTLLAGRQGFANHALLRGPRANSEHFAAKTANPASPPPEGEATPSRTLSADYVRRCPSKSQNMEPVIAAPGHSRDNHALSKLCGSRFYFAELV